MNIENMYNSIKIDHIFVFGGIHPDDENEEIGLFDKKDQTLKDLCKKYNSSVRAFVNKSNQCAKDPNNPKERKDGIGFTISHKQVYDHLASISKKNEEKYENGFEDKDLKDTILGIYGSLHDLAKKTLDIMLKPEDEIISSEQKQKLSTGFNSLNRIFNKIEKHINPPEQSLRK